MSNGAADLKLIFDALRCDVRDAVYGVLGSVELLEDGTLSPAQKANTRRCRASAHRVLRVIDDILMLSAETLVDSLTATFSPAERMGTIVEVLEPLAKAAGVVLETEIATTPLVKADVCAFEHVATRILEYAIRAANGGVIRVSLHYSEETIWLSVIVVDPGPNARADDLALHLARAVVTRMGGKFDHADSGYRISIQVSVQAKAVEPGEQAGGEPKIRVLIAEDSEESFNVFTEFLRDQPCLIDRAADGKEAVALATRGEHDVIFMDVGMPKLDGYGATRRIREWESMNGRRHVPIVVLSAAPIGSQMSEGAKAGCSGYLEKPVPRPVLIKALHRYAGEVAASSR